MSWISGPPATLKHGHNKPVYFMDSFLLVLQKCDLSGYVTIILYLNQMRDLLFFHQLIGGPFVRDIIWTSTENLKTPQPKCLYIHIYIPVASPIMILKTLWGSRAYTSPSSCFCCSLFYYIAPENNRYTVLN